MQYKCLKRVKTSDGVIHPVGDVVELSDNEARVCLSFHSVIPIPEKPKAESKKKADSKTETKKSDQK